MRSAALGILLCSLAGCATPIGADDVADLMEIQRQAWNRGDLPEFVSYYDPSMTFSGSDGVTRGTADLLARYRKSYPTAKERGVLTFRVTDVRPLGGSSALVLGEYALAREVPANGFFSLVVIRTPNGVRIIHDHTSAAER